jgi:hypothetical protein
MKLFCHLLLSAVMLLPLAGLSSANPPAPTHHPHQQHHRHHHRVHWVYYRQSPNAPWVCYGGYYQQNHAALAINFFRGQGFDAFVR